MDTPCGRLPDFIIIGSAKSGTTSLSTQLNCHPDVYLCNPKEPCFFDGDVAWNKGIHWYESLFKDAGSTQICGEASTNYTRWPQVRGVPLKIHRIAPKVKLIYVMRDPVQRAHSHFVHRWTKEVNPGLPFSETFASYIEKDRMCVDGSKYASQLDRYLEYFPREQVLLIVFERLIAKPNEVLDEVFSFLGLVPIKVAKLPRINENKEFRLEQVKKKVKERIASSRMGRLLLNKTPSFIKSMVYNQLILKTNQLKAISHGYTPSPLTSTDKEQLQNVFRQDVTRLREFYNVDTSLWGI